MDAKIYLLCRRAQNSRLYRDWPERCLLPTIEVDQAVNTWKVPDDAALLVTHNHYRWEELAKLREVLGNNDVPILILVDGVLEYRNTWCHPGLPDGSLFQPLFGHKLACLGNAQARVVESWGNAGRCEVVGFPAFDTMSELPMPASESFRLLVATAKTPWFDESQKQLVLNSIVDLKQAMEATAHLDGVPIEVDWRIAPEVAVHLGLEVVGPDLRPPLEEAMGNVHAVITTPSTLYLESVLYGRPTAVLDYHNQPAYVPSAWRMTSKDHFAAVLSELKNPPPAKLDFQQLVLHDQLQRHQSATERMVQLVDGMAKEGVECRMQRRPVQLPPKMLPPLTPGSQAPFDLRRAYTENEMFAVQDLQRLQIELTAAVERLDQLPEELAEKQNRVYDLMENNHRLQQRVRELHERVKKLRKRLGIEKE